ncbi:uncharacterized protein Cadr_000024407 [Camelus dromedarius]|uniref:Uncharacterized protein n=1 Tax=Camelus dromedarius TaxID=9838 RepID=A0A5N4CQU3_CAMDR|nr:uncharacterized protein Cadr_000024407 [Camelus dromedarius]
MQIPDQTRPQICNLIGLRVANLGTSGPHLPRASQGEADNDPDLEMLTAQQVPRSIFLNFFFFYSMYQNSDCWIEHIQILKIIVEMFLPHMNHLTLEQTFFSQVLPKTVKLFDDMMYELTSQARGLSSQNLEIQTTLRNILQNSESVYSGHLHLVSDLLQALFKEAYSLQKQLMELLDMVCMDPLVDENDDILNMVVVIHSLLDICSVISSMDHAFHANTWKFIIKQSLKHQSVIKSQLKHKDIITSLCEDTLFSFHSCLQLAEQLVQPHAQDNADYRLFQKTLKLCRFFANSLLHYTKEFLPFLSDSCCTLHQLYLQIHSKFPPSLYAARISKAQQEEIAGAFLVTLDPLISQLLTFQPFVQVVLDSRLELPCELQFPHCLLLVVIMDKLPSQPEAVQALWCADSQWHSVYQYQAAHPKPQPSYSDTALLDAVLSANMITSLLAMDAWCFLARYIILFLGFGLIYSSDWQYGTAELCAHHVTIVAHLIKSCPGECYQLTNLAILLKRLFFFMAPPHQVEFIQKFSPKEPGNLLLWQYISFQALPADLRRQTAREVSRVCTAQCREWLGSSRTVGELESLNTVLSALLTVCSSAGEALDSGQQTAVMEVGSQLWALLNIKLVTGQPYVQQTLSLLLPLLGFFIQTLDLQLISQVVTLQTSLLKLEPPDHVRLAVLDFVSSVGKLFIPQAMQDKILPSLSSIFASLLADRNWLLEQHTLEAFTQFAETGFVDETADARVERIKQEKGIFWEPFAKVTVEEAKWSSLQPLALHRNWPQSDAQARPLRKAGNLLAAQGFPPARHVSRFHWHRLEKELLV